MVQATAYIVQGCFSLLWGPPSFYNKVPKQVCQMKKQTVQWWKGPGALSSTSKALE